MLTALATAAVLGVGALRVASGDLTIGMLVAFQSLMVSFMTPIGQMVTLGTTLPESQGDLSRVDDVLRYETDPQVPAKIQATKPYPQACRTSSRAPPASEPHLRLQPPGAAPDRGLQPHPQAPAAAWP